MARLQLQNQTSKDKDSGGGESIFAHELLVIDLEEEDKTENTVMLCLESLDSRDIKDLFENAKVSDDHINDLRNQTFVAFYLSKRQARILGEHLISISK